MDDSKALICHCLLYDFLSGCSAAESERCINQALSSATCRRWFQKFREGDHSCEDKPRSGRPSVVDEDELCRHIEQNPGASARDLARAICTSHPTIMLALKKLGTVYKIGCWLPHQLDDSLRTRRVEACRILWSKSKDFSWLDQVITMDETYVTFSNPPSRGQMGRQRGEAGTRRETRSTSPAGAALRVVDRPWCSFLRPAPTTRHDDCRSLLC
jgi:HTH domain in Mos1 transposase